MIETMLKEPIIRIDYFDRSYAINIEMITYMEFTGGSIVFAFGNNHDLEICREDADTNGKRLLETFLNTYTKWKSHSAYMIYEED